jgi:short-subunit dehydrogenase
MGREVALEILRRGGTVLGIDIRADFLGETKELAGAKSNDFEGAVLDVTNREEVADLAAKHNDIDGLVNVAGIIQPFVTVEGLETSAVDRVMQVNFFGPLNLIQAWLPTLKSRPSAHILNVSSMGSYVPVPGQSIYGASKAALNLLTEGLRSELSASNVRLTLAWPGAIGTNIASNSGLTIPANAAEDSPSMKMTSSLTAAKLMVDAIERSQKRVYIGQDAKFMALLAKYVPDMAAGLIYKNLKHLLG